MVDLSPYAGAKGRTPATLRTSADAADMIAPARARLRRAALLALGELREATPLEIVEHTGLAREAIQPRLSELIALGLVEPTGARRRNPSGRSAAALRLTGAGWLSITNA
jgi:DNA-binding MarR family transcriptional regulator